MYFPFQLATEVYPEEDVFSSTEVISFRYYILLTSLKFKQVLEILSLVLSNCENFYPIVVECNPNTNLLVSLMSSFCVDASCDVIFEKLSISHSDNCCEKAKFSISKVVLSHLILILNILSEYPEEYPLEYPQLFAQKSFARRLFAINFGSWPFAKQFCRPPGCLGHGQGGNCMRRS